MTQPWVCASCRQTLRQQLQGLWIAERTVRNFNGSTALTQHRVSDSDGSILPSQHTQNEEQPAPEQREIPPHYERWDRSVEEDFLARILRSRNGDASSGPYSSPRLPRYKRDLVTRHKPASRESAKVIRDAPEVGYVPTTMPLSSSILFSAFSSSETPSSSDPVLHQKLNARKESLPEHASQPMSRQASNNEMRPKSGRGQRITRKRLNNTDLNDLPFTFREDDKSVKEDEENKVRGSSDPLVGMLQENRLVGRKVSRRIPSNTQSEHGDQTTKPIEGERPQASVKVRPVRTRTRAVYRKRHNLHINSEEYYDDLEKRVGRAVDEQNGPRLGRIWEDCRQIFDTNELPSNLASRRLHILTLLLRGLASLRRLRQAMDIWNYVISHGLQPTVSMWDALLRGCGVAHDMPSLTSVWQRMLDSGINPDGRAWSTRIHSLMTSGRQNEAISAFQEMTEQWIRSVQTKHGKHHDLRKIGDIEGSPKPTLEALNSIITGLSRRGKDEQVAEALQWLQRLGIKPDAYTFNPLLEAAISDENVPRAQKVLKLMKTRGVEPDVASFTILLDAVFRGVHILPDDPSEPPSTPTAPESSTSSEPTAPSSSSPSPDPPIAPTDALSPSIALVFRAMNRAGIAATTHTYGAMINGLLRSDPPNEAAVASVLAHMAAAGVRQSSAIYTTLLTHHFARAAGPDLAAVEALWLGALREPFVALDAIFYDRLIEGFARAGATHKALTALAQASRRRTRTSWAALGEILLALERAGDRGRMAAVVADVARQEREEPEERSRVGREEFWELVEDMGFEVPGRDQEL